MEGALTSLRLHGVRAAALRSIRESTAVDLGPLAAIAAEGSAFAAAAPLLEGAQRRDAAEAALAALAREREIHVRVLLQSGVAVVFVSGLWYAGVPVTRLLGALAALLSLPTWALAVGAPRPVLELLLAMPVAGRAALDMLHARSLSVLAMFVGSGFDPDLSRRIADDHVGRALPDAVIEAALGAGGFAQRAGLREESEPLLLRAAGRRVTASQIRARFLLLGLAAIALVFLFTPAFRSIDFAPEPARDARFVPATTSTGD